MEKDPGFIDGGSSLIGGTDSIIEGWGGITFGYTI